jgi:hypothetical protein
LSLLSFSEIYWKYNVELLQMGNFMIVLSTLFNTASSDTFQIPLESKDAVIEFRTVATMLNTRLDIILTRLDLIHTRLDLIPHSARSHPHSARSHPHSLYLIHTRYISPTLG